MANKFILVPQEIYRGLTTFDTGEPNLDDVRKTLDKTRRVREHPSAKNINYNQELRRYLHLRNEQQNRPVRVEMVASPKGGLMNNDPIRPTTNIGENEDDIWMSDDISFSSYPREPPNKAYNIVPTPSVYSTPSTIPTPSRQISAPRQSSKRKIIQQKGKESKKIKIKKEIKQSKIPILKNKKQKKRVSATSVIEQNPIIETQNVPSPPISRQTTKRPQQAEEIENNNNNRRRRQKVLKSGRSPSPPISRQSTKRTQQAEEIDDLRRRKFLDPNIEPEDEPQEIIPSQKDLSLIQKKKKDLLKRRRASQKLKVPLDSSEIQRMHRTEEIERNKNRRRRQKISKDGRSPSPPISRIKIKRKREGPPEGEEKRKRIPITKKQSEKAGRTWMLRLIKAKRKEAKSKNFKPSLW